MKLRIAMFYHSLISDWNHGNAHFLRGVATELGARGHELRIFEPQDGWSLANLRQDAGKEAVAKFHLAFPQLHSTAYQLDELQISKWLDNVDLAVVHEWSEPELVTAIGRYRRGNRNLRVFFHDTHHRALTAPQELRRFELSEYDGVLAYGASLKDAYQRQGWGTQVHVWHEGADTRVFYPRREAEKRGDVVWIGNWGDDERTQEIRDFFVRPIAHRKWKAEVRGVRYPSSALQELAEAGISYNGWIPNFEVPELFGQFRATVHVPRRPYTLQLPGIPTIRPFEALACGIPLVSAPWSDTENLFRVGKDFLMARDAADMERLLHDVIQDASLARALSDAGLETIRARHSCAHRVDELLAIYGSVKPMASMGQEAALSFEV